MDKVSEDAMRPWIKWHTERLEDVRLLKLSERQQLRYHQMYTLAGRLDADGSFIENGKQLDETDIAIKLRVNDVQGLIKDMKALTSAGLISKNGHGSYISDFLREQVSREEMDIRREKERQKKADQRARKRPANVPTGQGGDKNNSPKRPKGVPSKDQDQSQTKKKTKTQSQSQKKTTTQTSTASAKKAKPAKGAGSSVAGGGGNDSSSSSIDQAFETMIKTNSKAAENVRIIRPILIADGLGKQKFKETLLKVAMRILPSKAKQMTLAAIASAYADEDAKNKPMIAAHRLENEQVPSQFMNPATWRVIPDDVLKAAGINDLNDYIIGAAGIKTTAGKVAALRSN
jgi:hypothetical protein